MGLNCASVQSIATMTIGDGQPLDIFFFVSEISAGASKGHFNGAYSSVLYGYRTLGLACAKAIFAQTLGLRGATDAGRFIVARIAGQTVGAAFLREVDVANGSKVLLVEFLAVIPSARRQGVARTLLEYAQRCAPEGIVECQCAPESQAMQHLIKRMGFVRIQRSKRVDVKGARVALPSQWLWKRKA